MPVTVTLDLSLAREFRLGARHSVDLRFDVFNVANRRNVTQINNVIGLDADNPPATFSRALNYGDQRQAQVAIRYRF
jgi:hypothetical protein